LRKDFLQSLLIIPTAGINNQAGKSRSIKKRIAYVQNTSLIPGSIKTKSPLYPYRFKNNQGAETIISEENWQIN
jgi:hypothetical protein